MFYCWPLPGADRYSSYSGSFGAERKYDIHTGIDIYCEPNQVCCAMESGVVVKVEVFTGPNAEPPSPWWNETHAVFVEGNSGVIVYGEIRPLSTINIGKKISSGQILGHVVTVLRKDKGLPMTMLHVELYEKGAREAVIWGLGEDKPKTLLDPSKLFER